MPTGAEYLWDCFCELNAARGISGFGPSPITYTEIAAWCALTATGLEPWEVRIVKALDAAWLRALTKESK